MLHHQDFIDANNNTDTTLITDSAIPTHTVNSVQIDLIQGFIVNTTTYTQLKKKQHASRTAEQPKSRKGQRTSATIQLHETRQDML